MSNDTEMTTLVDKTELRNRFTPQATQEEKEQLQEMQEMQETQETQEEKEQLQETQETQEKVGTGLTEQASQETPSEEETEAADTPSESDASPPLPTDKYGREYVEADGKRYYAQSVIREDGYGRRYVIVKEEKFYAEDPSWNIPLAVTFSISLIIAINVINMGYAFAYLYIC